MNDPSDIAHTENLLKKQLYSECSGLLDRYDLSHHLQMLTSGRLLRSRIAIVSAAELDNRLVNLCLALELLHNSTLVHDDIIDQSDFRRGLPTISGTKGGETAILVGNLLASRAFAIVSEAGSQNMFTFFAKAYEDVNAAQLLELQRRATVDKSLDTYIEICRGKTVSMLQLGMIIGASPREIEMTHPLMQAIHYIGLAFQLADDIEDVEDWLAESDSSRSKHSTADIELGNYTAPTILAARVNAREADPRSIDPRHISRKDWEQGLDEARARRNSFVKKAVSYCAAAVRRPDDLLPYSQRLAPWLARVGDSLRTGAVDDTVSIS